MDVAVGHHHDSGARRHAGDDVAGAGEIRVVVGDNLIVEQPDTVTGLLRQIGQVEHQDAAGVAGRDIVMDVGKIAVLDLDAGDVAGGAAIADNDLLRLADIDTGV